MLSDCEDITCFGFCGAFRRCDCCKYRKRLPLPALNDCFKVFAFIPLYPIGYKAIAENKLIPIEIRWFLQNHQITDRGLKDTNILCVGS